MVGIHDVGEAVLVAAHPDDEILWFSSVLKNCQTVVVCFGPSATSTKTWDEGRAQLIDAYPFTNTRFLKIRESGAFGTAGWGGPYDPEAGLRLLRPSNSYGANGHEIIRMLRPILEGKRLVITHNPWGEYGHEEHVQVSRAVMALKAELGFELLVNGYVSNLSSSLMLSSTQLISGPPLVLKTDVALAAELKQLYTDYNCWTFHDDYVWPDWEAFYPIADPTGGAPETRAPDGKATTTATPPLTYINHKFLTTRLQRTVAEAMPESVKTLVKRMIGRG